MSDDSDLTSVTALARTLEFVGTVYVEPGASDATILATVRAQAQTAFGPLRTSNVAVNSRELKDVDTKSFVKTPVTVVDPSKPDGVAKPMLQVKYTYLDDAVVDRSFATRSAVPLALLHPSYRAQSARILSECTTNDSHAREFASSLWYVFEPSLSTCQKAMRDEQAIIDQDRKSLADPRAQVSKSEVERLYLPIEAKLGADKTNRGDSYPDYHRLYAGGVKDDKLVISLVFGLIDHEHPSGYAKDFNYGELMTTLSEVMAAEDGWRLVPGPDAVDLSRFTLPSGKTVERPSITDLVNVHARRDGLGLSSTDRAALDEAFANAIFRRWITIERPVTVSVAGEAPRAFAVQFLVYFGVENDHAPHAYATKNSDVFFYNGHSYIGAGPLDPARFTKDDFPSTYQLFWIDGCVSYNYYEKDYFPLKAGGTKNLDVITNGIEAPAWRSGHAMGQFLLRFLDGKGASYRDLLLAARDTEALRVVDGELDNEFSPARFPIRIEGR